MISNHPGRRQSSFKDTSIIVVHYDGLDQLRECLDSVLRSDAEGAELIVVDNASIDSCTEAIGGRYPLVRFVKAPRNLGSSGGWNLGARAASGRFLVFLNDDVVVPPQWIGFLESQLSNPQVGVASSIALFLDNPHTINSAGGLLDFLGFAQNRAVGQAYRPPVGDTRQRPFYAVGTAFATRKEVFESTGGFDEEMFMYADDVDWSWRLRLLGYVIILEERSVVYHKWHGSGVKLDRMAYYLERNEVRAVLKNYRTATLAWIAPTFLAVKLAKACAFAVVDRRFVRAILAAWYWNLANLRQTLRQRGVIQSTRRVTDRTIVREMVMGSLELRVGFGWTHHPLRSAVGDRSARL